MADARRRLFDDLDAMAHTGRNPLTGGRIGAALTRQLPKLIDAARHLLGPAAPARSNDSRPPSREEGGRHGR